MRSLFVYTENYFRGGGNRYTIDLVNGVNDIFDKITIGSNPKGIFESDVKRLKKEATIKEYQIFTSGRILINCKVKNKLFYLFIRLLTIILEPFMFLYNVLLFMGILGRCKPDAVLACNGGYPAGMSVLALTVASKLCNLPVVLSVVSVPFKRNEKFLFFGKVLDHLVWTSTNLVIVNADAIVNCLREYRELPKEKAFVVYNGLEKDVVKYEKDEKYNSKFVVGLVARLDKSKGVLNLVEAFINIHKKYFSTYLILAGEGDSSDYIKKTIAEKGISDSVEMLGHYSGDIQKLVSNFDVYVFPSLHEGFPYSILEAMRSGCSIISTNVGGIPEAIENEKQGILVNPGSIEELEKSIEKLILDEDFRKRIGLEASKTFYNRFSVDSMYVSVKEAFLKLKQF